MICLKFKLVGDNLETRQQVQMVSNCIFVLVLLCVVAPMKGRAGRQWEPAAASEPLVNLKHPICMTWEFYLRCMTRFKFELVCDNLETKQQFQMLSNCIVVGCFTTTCEFEAPYLFDLGFLFPRYDPFQFRSGSSKSGDQAASPNGAGLYI